jgi:type II secretory pathway pseudopilin PulG
MNKSAPIRRPARSGEEGFGLLAVVFLVALLTLSLAVAMPKVIKQIQRDRELETMHRGKQYARAVRMYYKKFGAYPPNADALIKPTNNIRFLRKKYADLTTGRPDWKPVLLGQNKAPTAMGFFGQPLGGIGGCVTNPLGTSASSVASSSSSFGGTTGSPTDASSNCSGTGLNTSTTASTDTTATNSTDPNAANNGSSTTQSAFGQPGQTFGGAGIIGFSPNSPKPSILVYKTKTHYNEWEFVYDPRAELMQAQGGNQGGGYTGQQGAPTFSPQPTSQTSTPQQTATQQTPVQ